jgi:polar amino acid transport system substrate-binding protein
MERGEFRMRASRPHFLFALLVILATVGAACSDSSSTTTDPGAGGTSSAPVDETVCASADTSAGDLLAEVCDAGEIRVSTDPAYPPQSSLNQETGEYEGFDIDVAAAIADRLGVDIEWETPSWTAITAGNWQDRWDMSVGSMTVTAERAEVLDFSPAYYFTPASVAVEEDSEITTVEQLDGKTVGVCAGCTYDAYLNGTLDIPGFEFEPPPFQATVKGYDTDTTAIQAVLSGQADGVMSATPTLQEAIDKDRPLRLLGDPLFYEPLSVAFDKSSELDQSSLVEAVSDIVEDLHADGTLTELSMEWYGEDLTVEQQ